MKKFIFTAFAALVVFSATGCQVLKSAETEVVGAVEKFVHAPPQAVVDGAHAALNFGESLLGLVFQAIFHGLLPF